METKHPSKSTVIRFLKKRTFEIIAAIAAVIAAYYGYKSYMDNQYPQLKIEYRNLGKSKNVKDIFFFKNLIVPHEEKAIIPYNRYENLIVFGVRCSNEYYATGIPYIANKSKKSMKHFQLAIRVYYSNCLELPFREINEDYEIVKMDTSSNDLTLKYKNDILYGGSAIPIPIRFMYLSESENAKDKDWGWVHFTYEIAYDGIEEPISFWIDNVVYFDTIYPKDVSDKHIDEYLTDCYYGGCFTDRRKRTLVSIIDVDREELDIVTPPKRLTDKKFEKYKKRFIEKRKTRHGNTK